MKGDSVRVFYLQRDEDVSGVSGTGIIARGAILPTGRVVLEWTSNHPTLEVHNNVNEVELIHGHGGRTRIIMGAPNE